MSRYIVGLTGGIGCGKSTVTALFAKLGVQHVDADLVAREVVMPGTACFDAICEQFGNNVITESGTLDRAALRQRIFTNNTDKLWLEQLLHPAIRTELLQQLAALLSPYVLLVAPLLLENALDKYVHRVLVIDLPEALQLQRAMARDNADQQQIQAIMAAQITRAARLERADDIINNDSTVAALQAQVNRLHRFYLQQADSTA
ncbi:MAG: dephospho-CoA kinase [Gammaproteobacteria bacterium]|nr:dephospho-CoA kinase [Gammaproteobacteria bacterium]